MIQNIDKKYQRFLRQESSPEEANELLDYFATTEGQVHLTRLMAQELDKETLHEFDDPEIDLSIAQNRDQLMHKIRERNTFRLINTAMFKYVAVLFVIITLGITWFNIANHTKQDDLSAILPPSNKATLTIANGQKIELSDKRHEIRMHKGSIHYSDGTSVTSRSNPVELVSLTTPRGGIYQVVLSDNSKVWLNAATTLSYPVRFSGTKREVEIDGEAYFEISENKSLPFVVKSKGQEIKVLGTAFNVSAYKEEKETRTTLVKGVVEIFTPSAPKSLVKLLPAEEAVLMDRKFKIRKVDPDMAIGWRDGNFSFDDEPLENIMNKISRWYDVEISYNGVGKSARYFGWVSRYDNLEVVLKRLERASDLRFRIEGRRVVMIK